MYTRKRTRKRHQPPVPEGVRQPRNGLGKGAGPVYDAIPVQLLLVDVHRLHGGEDHRNVAEVLDSLLQWVSVVQ